MHLLLGGNGSGKSSLLRTLVQALPALSGKVSMSDGDQELRPRSERHWTKSMAFVSSRPPQQVGLTVEEVWALSGNPSDVEAWHPDLMGLASSRLSELSDGQAQQVMVARAMLQSDRWLVLDEPTAFLDVKAQRRLWRMLEGHVARGGGVLMATHDLWGVERWAQAQPRGHLVKEFVGRDSRRGSWRIAAAILQGRPFRIVGLRGEQTGLNAGTFAHA